MINFDIIFEATQSQKEAIKPLKQKLISIQDINGVSPESLLAIISEFAITLDLKTMDDLIVATNPNAGVIDDEFSTLIWNVLHTYQQRIGTAEAEKQIADNLSK